MKITIEPTENYGNETKPRDPKVELWVPGDDHDLDEVIEYLVVPALRAMGYSISEGQVVVNEYKA